MEAKAISNEINDKIYQNQNNKRKSNEIFLAEEVVTI